MKFFIYAERINLLHKLISEQKTGNPKELAKRINLSESRLYCVLEYLKLHNVPIEYNRRKRSYCYSQPFNMKALIILKPLDNNELENISAGFSAATFFIEQPQIVLYL